MALSKLETFGFCRRFCAEDGRNFYITAQERRARLPPPGALSRSRVEGTLNTPLGLRKGEQCPDSAGAGGLYHEQHNHYHRHPLPGTTAPGMPRAPPAVSAA